MRAVPPGSRPTPPPDPAPRRGPRRLGRNRPIDPPVASPRPTSDALGASPEPDGALDPLPSESFGLVPADVARALADPSRRIGRLALLDELGRGGMGIVYRAWDSELRRAVAVKLLMDTDDSGHRERRFEREAQAIGRLSHPNIVRIHEVGAHAGRPYIVMELVEGQDLERVLAAGTLAPREVARIAEAIAHALHHAHQTGVVHRDVKPPNIVIDRSGQPRLMDFGLARRIDGHDRLTQTGHLIGTPAYMAPEQVASDSRTTVGPEADVYALGAVAFRALTGRPPFDVPSVIHLMRQIAAEPPPSPRSIEPAVPRPLDAIILRCLAKAPSDRYGSALQLAHDLRRFLDGDTIRAEAPSRIDDALRRLRTRAGIATTAILTVAAALLAAAVALRPVGVPADGDAGAPDRLGATTQLAPPAAPWPAPAELRLAWSLADEARPPSLAPAALWDDEVGRVAAPLRGVVADDPDALAAAFLGDALLHDDGRVALRYDLARAAWLIIDRPTASLVMSELRTAIRPSSRFGADHPDAIAIEAPNDAGTHRLRFGQAIWERPTARVRLIGETIDATFISLVVNGGNLPYGPGLHLRGREGRASIAEASVAFELGGPHDVVFAPGGPAGARVQVDGQTLAELDDRVARPQNEGFVEVAVAEGRFHIGHVEVLGRPLRPDVAAVATAPVESTETLRVAAAFERERGSVGGPFVAIESERGSAIRATLSGDRLTIHDGHRPILEAALPGADAASGWLAIERSSDRVGVTVHVAGRSHELAIATPFPRGAAPARARYGSTAPRTRFTAVQVHASARADDPDRASWDALRPEDPDELTDAALAAFEEVGASSPRVAWRTGALLLARAIDPRWAPRAAHGHESLVRRRREAARAVLLLERAATDPSVPDVLQRDALSRAILAAVLSADAAGAERLARMLAERSGVEGAREQVDRLEGPSDGMLLTQRLAGGWGASHTDPRIAIAATSAASVIAPDLSGQISYCQASAIRDLTIRALEQSGARRPSEAQARDLRQALILYERALAAGHEPCRVHESAAPIHAALGDPEAAANRWALAIDDDRFSSWRWRRFAHSLQTVGRFEEAIGATIGGLAVEPRSRASRETIAVWFEDEERRLASPGHVATAVLLLGETDAVSPETAERLRLWARDAVAAPARGSARDRDLALYVRVRLGERPEVPDGDRPTLALTRARLARSDDAGALIRAAAAADRTVWAIATLDPVLGPLLVE